jgi:hypothetical protein
VSCCGHRIGIVHAVAGLYLCSAAAFGAENREDYVYKAMATGNDNGLVTVWIDEPKNTSLCKEGDNAYMYGVPEKYREFRVNNVQGNNITLESVAKGFSLNVEGAGVWLVTWSDVGSRWQEKLQSRKGKDVEEVLREVAAFRDPKGGRYKENAYLRTRSEVDAVWSSVPLNNEMIGNYRKAFGEAPPAVLGTLEVNNTGEVPIKVEIGGQAVDVKPHQSVRLSVTAGVKHSVKYEPTGENADDFNVGEKEVMVPIEGKLATVLLAATVKGDPVLTVRNTGDVALQVTVLAGGAKVKEGTFELAKGASREVTVPPGMDLKIRYEVQEDSASDYDKGEAVQTALKRGTTATKDLTATLKPEPVLTVRNTGAVALQVTVLAGGAKVKEGTFELAKGASREVTVPPGMDLKIRYEAQEDSASDYDKGEAVQTALKRGTTATKDLTATLKPEPVLTVRNTGAVALKVTVLADGEAVGKAFELEKGASWEVTVPPHVPLTIRYEPLDAMIDGYVADEAVQTALKRGTTATKDLTATLKPEPVLTVRNTGAVALQVTVLAGGDKVKEGTFELEKEASREVTVPPGMDLKIHYEPIGNERDAFEAGEAHAAALERGTQGAVSLSASKSLAGRLQDVRDILEIKLMGDVTSPEEPIRDEGEAWEALAVSKRWFDDFMRIKDLPPPEEVAKNAPWSIRLAGTSLDQLGTQAHRIRAAGQMAKLPPVDKTPDDLKEWRKWAEGFLRVLDGGEAEFSREAQAAFVLVQRGLRALDDNSLAGVETFGEFIRGKGDDGKKGR